MLIGDSISYSRINFKVNEKFPFGLVGTDCKLLYLQYF